jgi:hypothetical protein
MDCINGKNGMDSAAVQKKSHRAGLWLCDQKMFTRTASQAGAAGHGVATVWLMGSWRQYYDVLRSASKGLFKPLFQTKQPIYRFAGTTDSIFRASSGMTGLANSQISFRCK